MTTAEYMKLRYGNRARRHWWGIAHRKWLLRSGQYVKTSEQRGTGLMQFLRGPLPEYTPDPVGAWGKRLEQLRKTYPRQPLSPQHHGADYGGAERGEQFLTEAENRLKEGP